MSMWLNLAKVSPATLSRIRKDPEAMEPLFFDSERTPPADFHPEKDVFGEDYRSMSAVMEGMTEAGVPCDALKHATGDGAGAEVDYDFCYGPGFCFDPEEVRTIAEELVADPDGFGLSEFFTAARSEGKGIVGGIS